MIKTRVCKTCGVEKRIDQFEKQAAKVNKYRYRCKACRNIAHKAAIYRRNKTGPMSEMKGCTMYLGVHVAESLAEAKLNKLFRSVERMAPLNPGFDFKCDGLRIDAKSGCLVKNHKSYCWSFRIDRNKDTDYFILLGFDSRVELKLKHMWLIPAKEINMKRSLVISDLPESLEKWKEYEKPLGSIDEYCEKGNAKVEVA